VTTQGRFALIDALTRKGNCPPRHIHRNEDESFYILEGEITAWIGDQTIRGTPGTLIFGPRGVPHSFETHSDQVRTIISALSKQGEFRRTRATQQKTPTGRTWKFIPAQQPDSAKLNSCLASWPIH
jgi:mannose-6-phosphate isomerase-like protein (cupin superfamily)